MLRIAIKSKTVQKCNLTKNMYNEVSLLNNAKTMLNRAKQENKKNSNINRM